jgi:WD40 repeat protein
LLRAESGAPISFPGPLLAVAPDGERVLVHRSRGLELWAIDPPEPLVSVPRPRTVVARSRDGVVSVAVDREHVVIERAGRCTELDIAAARRDALELSPDGRELYLGIDQSLRPPGAVIRHGKVLRTALTSALTLWQTETGELTSSIHVLGPAQVYPIPSVGRVGFGVTDGVWIYDVRTGRLVTVAAPPRVRQSAPDAHGTSRPFRDLDGDSPDALSGPVAAFADGNHLAGGSRGARMSIWDLEDPRRVQDLPEVPNADWQEVVALAPDERHLATGARNGVIGLWARDGTAIPVIAMHDAWVEHLAFSPDGRVLASSARDGIVLLTSATSGAPVGKIALTADHATFLWWSPDSAGLVIDTARGFQLTIAPQPPGDRP